MLSRAAATLARTARIGAASMRAPVAPMSATAAGSETYYPDHGPGECADPACALGPSTTAGLSRPGAPLPRLACSAVAPQCSPSLCPRLPARLAAVEDPEEE